MGNNIFYFLFFLCFSPSLLVETLSKKKNISYRKLRLIKRIKFNKKKLRFYKRNLRKKRKIIKNKKLWKNYYNFLYYSCHSNSHDNCEEKYKNLEKKFQELEKNLLSQGQQGEKEKEEFKVVKNILEQQQKEQNNNQKNHDTCDKNYNHLRENLQNLEKKCDHQHENLNKENNGLKKDHRFLHQKFQNLEEKYDDSRKENENLNKDNQYLQQELHKKNDMFQDIKICINHYDDLIYGENKEEKNKDIERQGVDIDQEENIEKEIEEIERKIKEKNKLFQKKEINAKKIIKNNIGLSDIKECYSEENYSDDFYTQEKKKKNLQDDYESIFFEDFEEQHLSQNNSLLKDDIAYDIDLYPSTLSKLKSPVCQTFSLHNDEEEFLLSPQLKTKIINDSSFLEDKDNFLLDDPLDIKKEIEDMTSKKYQKQFLQSKSIHIEDIDMEENLKKTELSVIDEKNIDNKLPDKNNTGSQLFDTNNIEGQQFHLKDEESLLLLEKTGATQLSLSKKLKTYSKKKKNKHKRYFSDMTQDKTSSSLRLIKGSEKDPLNKSYDSIDSPVRNLYEEIRYHLTEKEIDRHIPSLGKNYKVPPPSPKEEIISFEAKHMWDRQGLGHKSSQNNNMNLMIETFAPKEKN